MDGEGVRTAELLARLKALATTVAAQERRIARQEAELARLGTAAAGSGRAGAANGTSVRPVVAGRRATLRRLVLGVGATAVGLLAAARPERAQAGANVTDTGDSTASYGVLGIPGAGAPPAVGFGGHTYGVVGMLPEGSSSSLTNSAGVVGFAESVRGVYGLSTHGIGVKGESNSNSAVVGDSTSGTGVEGFSDTGNGVQGFSGTGTGVRGSSIGNFTQGVLGQGTAGNAHGVTGTSINAFGLSGTSTNSNGFVGVNTNGNTFAGLFIGHAANPNSFTAPGIYVKGRAVITGGFSASAVTSQGTRLLHGIQAADDLAEEVGRATLSSGRARVNLDPLFAETIKADDYHVFLTPRSADTKGLAVVAQDGRGFTVQEAQGGTGSYPFDWRVVAERKGAPAGSRLMRHEGVDVRRVLEQLPARPSADPPEPPAQREPTTVPSEPSPPTRPPSLPGRRP